MFRFEGQDYSFASLGYNGRTEAGYRTFEGDEYLSLIHISSPT